MMQDYWQHFLSKSPLTILTDLDGSMLPAAAASEDALASEELVGLLNSIVDLPDVSLGIVSGRSRAVLDTMFEQVKGLHLMAEHGVWSRSDGDWTSSLELGNQTTESLAGELERFVQAQVGAFVERKTWSAALHYRRVPFQDRPALLVRASAIVQRWLKAHPLFERLDGIDMIEVRPRQARKSNAVAMARQCSDSRTRILAIGNDLTDEDMFDALSPDDAAILVASEPSRPTAAKWFLRSSQRVSEFLRGVCQLRRSGQQIAATICPRPIRPASGNAALSPYDLLVVSNRLPELRSSEAGSRTSNVGGLVAALHPVMTARSGIWLGWSGRTLSSEHTGSIGFDESHDPPVAWLDFSEAWHRDYYKGFCNSVLWPLFHSFPERMRLDHSHWQAYMNVNKAFALASKSVVKPGAMVWAHDYHLMLLARYLKRDGLRGPVGLFLHIPFPSPDMFFLLPWARDLLDALMDFDLIGFHTAAFAENFRRCMATLPGVACAGDRVTCGARSLVVRRFPIGIIPETFQEKDPAAADDVLSLKQAIHPCQLILGVDRLDYTKGIPERIRAFGVLLEKFPEWRRKVALVQISVPSRADISDYEEQRSRVEEVVGRINGQFGDTDWVPIRYLYRSYSHAQLSELYRAACIGYVTPLRDGMNLVAKEYVAAQDSGDPGVLVLSQFAGAAEELHEAILCNPWDVEGMAEALDLALRLDLAERIKRHTKLHSLVCKSTAETWARDFLDALSAGTSLSRP